jgi:uncharacterized protein (TIGR03437 family)
MAQTTITDVVNAGSRIGSGFPNAGIAQGAIFLITGTNVGADPLTQAAFPLPTTDGLGGVTVQATVGGATVDCIMVYISAKEVAAILPSATPTGAGTVTLNNNGTTATFPITVVAATFGSFTQNRTGTGAALAFNVAADGSATLNSVTQTAKVGQNVMLNGTGLGAITSDETQSGDTDVPVAGPTVFVGTQQATVVSYGRGACCTGIDPAFPVPQGVAGWDVIQFTVPAGITGCHVPVVVQTATTVSNYATIAVGDASGACTDPNGFNSNTLQNVSGSSLKTGTITLSRTATKITMQGQTITSNADTGSASFTSFDLTTGQSPADAFTNVAALGSCIVVQQKLYPGQTPIRPNIAQLDAGPVINVKGPNGTKQMTPSSTGGYSGNFGTSTVIPGLPGGLPPGLPPGLPGLPTGSQPFLDAGTYAADNGTGGADVKGFVANLTIPTPLTWTNMDAITTVRLTQGVNVTWTGGGNSTVNIVGTSGTTVNGVMLAGLFICTAPAAAGQFAVPAIVTESLPPSSQGGLSVGSTVSASFNATGINVGTISSSVVSFKNVAYQ